MSDFLDARHKETLSNCVQSILVSAGERIASAADLQSVFDSVLSTAFATNAKYAYVWNGRQRDSSFSRLPDELLVYCLAFLDLADWLHATLVSHRWHTLVETPSVWSKVTVKHPYKFAKDDAKVSWLSQYLAKSVDASLDIQWQQHNITAPEIELISANMHRTAHFEVLQSMDIPVPSSLLGQRAVRLKTFSLKPMLESRGTAGDIFDFEVAFGAEQHADLRKMHVGLFTLPVGVQCLPTVTDFEGTLQADDASNLQLFNILPNLSAVTLWLQTQPVIPTGPFPITLQTLRFKDVQASASVGPAAWEPLLASAINPLRIVSFDTISNLEVPFELFRRAVPNEFELAAKMEYGRFSMLLTRFTLTPAGSSTTDTICHSFCAMEQRWKSFVCSPSGATAVARSSLLVSLKLTSQTFLALLQAAADLPALLVFTLLTSDGSTLPNNFDVRLVMHGHTPITANNLREFILELDGLARESAARWFTRFLPRHIGGMFKYTQPRLERLAFVMRTREFEGEFDDKYAWGGVAQLANKVHVGSSLDASPLLVPSETDEIPDGSDWESDVDEYLDQDDDYGEHYYDDSDDPYAGYGEDDYDDYNDSGYDWQ